MKKNRRGFTLVELLAAIVILGILVGVGLPTIVGLLDNSKDKLYIDAATKMIAQAEYKMRSSGNEIERPDADNAIVISLVYLDDVEFDSPPGNGEYLKEASFVVVKNTRNGLEYSATVVEKLKKGGYKGIKLTRDIDLTKKNATKFVKVQKEDEIVCVEESDTAECKNSTIDMLSYINAQLGNDYVEEVESTYNYPSLEENTYVGVDKPPSVSGTISSVANVKSYNSFNALLSIKATDDNTLSENLKLYLFWRKGEGGDDDDGFASARTKTAVKFNSSGRYERKFDFAKEFRLTDYDGSLITIYSVVVDEAGNATEKKFTYNIHANRAPIINTSSSATFIKKRDSDEVAMPKALLGLSVDDDIDNMKDLEVCIAAVVEGRSGNLNNCTNYKKYSTLFVNGETMEYDFGGSLDGRVINMRIHVRDSSGAKTSANLKYTVHRNTQPEIRSFELNSKDTGFTSESVRRTKGGSLSTILKLRVYDDMDIPNLDIKITCEGVDTIETKYGTTGTYTIDYELPGTYDGSTHKVTVEVKDRYGQTVTKEYDYKVYTNKAPVISAATITSDGNACSDSSICPTSSGGSLDTIVSIKATDDMDSDQHLMACVSESEDYCEDASNFLPYSEFSNKSFSLTATDMEKPYDGASKKVYLAVMDTLGSITSVERTYKLYGNKSPTIGDMTISTEVLPNLNYDLFTDDFGDLNLNKANLKFSAVDDDDVTDLTFKVCKKLETSDGEETEEVCGEDNSYSDFAAGGNVIPVDFSETRYEGQKYTVTVKLKDSYGHEVSKSVDYQLYNDKGSIIDSFSVESSLVKEEPLPDNPLEDGDYDASEGDDPGDEGSGDPASASSLNDTNNVKINAAIPFEEVTEDEEIYNTKRIRYKFYIRDPLDTYDVCIGTENTYDKCIKESPIFSGKFENINGFINAADMADVPWDYDGIEREIFLTVKDSYGHEDVASYKYKIYERCSEMLYDENNNKIFDFEYKLKDPESLEINVNTCGGKCYVPTDGAEKITSKYSHTINYLDKFLNTADDTKECTSTSDVDVDCSYYMCFQREDDATKFYKAVGTNKIDVEWSHMVTEKVTKIVTKTVVKVIDGVEQEVEEEVEEEVLEEVEHVHSNAYKIYEPVLQGETIYLKETADYACPDMYSNSYYVPSNGYVIINDVSTDGSGN